MSNVFFFYLQTPLTLLLKKPKSLLATLCAIHIISMVLVIGTPFGFPYSGDVRDPALQRFYVFVSINL